MREEKVFMAALQILAASATGGKGEGLHVSPVHVSSAVDLAELLVAEIEKRCSPAPASATEPPGATPTQPAT